MTLILTQPWNDWKILSLGGKVCPTVLCLLIFVFDSRIEYIKDLTIKIETDFHTNCLNTVNKSIIVSKFKTDTPVHCCYVTYEMNLWSTDGLPVLNRSKSDAKSLHFNTENVVINY